MGEPSAIISPPIQDIRRPFSFWTDGFRRRLGSEQSRRPRRPVRTCGFNRLFFPALEKQRLAFAAAPTEVWKICRGFSAAYSDHNYTVPVQISRKVILPPGVTRVSQMKGGGYCTLVPSALARRGRAGGWKACGETCLPKKGVTTGKVAVTEWRHGKNSERHCPGRSNPVTHCCHSPPAPCRARQTSKAAPCHLTCSLSANQPILPQIKPVKSPLTRALSSWCPSAREGQQSRRRRLALSLVASQGRDNAGCEWPSDCLPASRSAFQDRRRAEELLSGVTLANEVPVMRQVICKQ